MKINGFGPLGMNPYKKQIDRQLKTDTAAQRSDKVEISSAALELQGSSNDYQVRQEKIQKLREQIDNGQYRVNAEEVAKKLADYYNN